MARKTIDILVDHALDFDDAKARVQALGDYYVRKYGATVTWEGDTAKVTGAYMVVPLDVAVEVMPRSIRLETVDPGRLLRKRMAGYARRKLLSYLDPSKSPEDLARI